MGAPPWRRIQARSPVFCNQLAGFGYAGEEKRGRLEPRITSSANRSHTRRRSIVACVSISTSLRPRDGDSRIDTAPKRDYCQYGRPGSVAIEHLQAVPKDCLAPLDHHPQAPPHGDHHCEDPPNKDLVHSHATILWCVQHSAFPTTLSVPDDRPSEPNPYTPHSHTIRLEVTITKEIGRAHV